MIRSSHRDLVPILDGHGGPYMDLKMADSVEQIQYQLYFRHIEFRHFPPCWERGGRSNRQDEGNGALK